MQIRYTKGMRNSSGKTLLVNTFGALGYLCCLLLWGWIGILFLPMLLENKHVEQFLLPTPSESPPVVQPAAETSPLLIVVAVSITVVVLIMTIIVLLRAPKTIAKTGRTVTLKAANSALPLVARGKELTPAKQRRLTTRLVKLAKLLLAVLPVAATCIGFIVEPPLPFDIVVFASSALAISALLWFSAQYGVARLLSVDPTLLV